jgi:hypothetical protein
VSAQARKTRKSSRRLRPAFLGELKPAWRRPRRLSRWLVAARADRELALTRLLNSRLVRRTGTPFRSVVRLGSQSTEARLVRAEDFRDAHTCGARKSGTHVRAEVLVARGLQLTTGPKEPRAFRRGQNAECGACAFEIGGLLAPDYAAAVGFTRKKGTKVRRMNFQAMPRRCEHARRVALTGGNARRAAAESSTPRFAT